MTVDLYNVTDSVVVFTAVQTVAAASAISYQVDEGGGIYTNVETYEYTTNSATGTDINPVSLIAGKTYRARAKFVTDYTVASGPPYGVPTAEAQYTVNLFTISVLVYNANTKTTINAAGFQSLIDGSKYLEVRNGTELNDFTTGAASDYSVSVAGDILFDGLFIKKYYSGSSFWKYYPSLVAQCIVYATSNPDGTGTHQKLSAGYVFQIVGDGIASVARNSTGVYTVTLKRDSFGPYPNVVVSGTGETYNTAQTTTKYGVTFLTKKTFQIRCVSSNSLTLVDPYMLNIAVFAKWDTENKYD